MLSIFSLRQQPEDAGRINFKDSKLRPIIKRSIWAYLEVMMFNTFMIWTGLSIFLGAIYERSAHAHNLDIYVVDLDGGTIGSTFTRNILDIKHTLTDPTWHEMTGFSTVAEVKEWVRVNSWGALVINPGASDRLNNAINNGAEYDPTQAITLIPSTGRHVVAEMLYVEKTLAAVAYSIGQTFALTQVNSYIAAVATAQTGADIRTNYEALFNPIAYTTDNASPMGFGIAAVLTTFSTLCLLLTTISFLIMWKLTTFSLFLKTKYRDLVLMWFVLLLGLALYLSLFVALAILAYRGPDYNSLALTFTAATFFKLWFTVAAEALVLELWLFNWFLHLPPHVLAWPSIATVISDVVSCIGCPELSTPFFKIMYAIPAYNSSRIVYYILSGAYPHSGKHAGILIAEIVAMGLLLCVSIWIRQLVVIRGISDAHGFYRGYTYFHSTVPYYKSDPTSTEHNHNNIESGNSHARMPKQIGVNTLENESTLSGGRYNHGCGSSSDIEISDCIDDNVSLRDGAL